MSRDEGQRLVQMIRSVDPHVVFDNTSFVDINATATASNSIYISNTHKSSQPLSKVVSEIGRSLRSVRRSRFGLELPKRWYTPQHLHSAARAWQRSFRKKHAEALAIHGREPDSTPGLLTKLQTAAGPADVIAKPPSVHQDIWDSLVAPSIGCRALKVESWLHGWQKLPDRCQGSACVVNAAGVIVHMPGDIQKSVDALSTAPFAVNLTAGHFPFEVSKHWGIYQDHAKWAVCCSDVAVCFGDMNRMMTQRRRGGLAICFRPPSDGGLQFAGQLHDRLKMWLLSRSTSCSGCACSGH